MYFIAFNEEQIRAAIVFGNRPPLDAIKGPADLVSFATKWIPLCWHESPDERPTFDSKYNVLEIQLLLSVQCNSLHGTEYNITCGMCLCVCVSVCALVLGLNITKTARDTGSVPI